MAVDIQSLQSSADGLFATLANNSDEVNKRVCISRSYYAIFHIIKQYIEQHLAQYPMGKDCAFKTGVHNQIYLILADFAQQTNDKSIKKLALQFKDFHTKRCQSDYELEQDISDYDVQMAKKYYENIPNLLNDLKP